VANRRHGVQRAAKKTKNQVWTTILADDLTLGAGATTSLAVVDDADWTVVGGSERATIMRVRGWMSVITKGVTGSFARVSMFSYIGVSDEDAPPESAAAVGTYAEEDIMATYGTNFAFTDTGTVGRSWDQLIDVKAMRKIRTGQQCRLVLTNSGIIGVFFSLVVRALVRRSG